MASGSYNIDTFSWYRSLPLSNDTTPFSTLTMFAVGPSSFMKNYTFYDYTWANGFPDTSTFSVSITNYVRESIISTTSAIGKTFMSTIPYTRWRAGGNTYEWPVAGGVPEPYDYTASYSDGTLPYPLQISTPSVWLGDGLTRLINSKEYNVFVDSQYSLFLSSGTDRYTWVSTIGLFSNATTLGFGPNNQGRMVTSRLGNNQFIDIHSKMMYMPQPAGTENQILQNTSSFYLDIYLVSSIFNSNVVGAPTCPAYDIYIPGENNLTFTLVPAVSTLTVY
jgi:hypothetical protein